MNSKDVRALAKIMNEYGLSFIEWKDENSSVTLKKDCLTGETASKSSKDEIEKVHNNVGNVADDISDKEDFNDVIDRKSVV